MINARKMALLLSTSLAFIIAGICIYRVDYIYSFVVAFMSYLCIIVASYGAISAKLKDKIEYAKKLELLEKDNANNEDITESSAKSKAKRRLRFIDFSKAQLGFELSFSFSRVIAFACMITGLVVLALCNVFYVIAYIAGVLIASFFTIVWLLMIKGALDCNNS